MRRRTTGPLVRSILGGAAALLASGLVLSLGGCTDDGAAQASTARTAAPAATGAAPARPSASSAEGTALAVLATLPVKGRAPMTGYVRTERFGAAWLDVDRNGCDTRDDILRRDLTHVSGSRCIVRSGVLQDPYTGERIDFQRGVRTSTAVQIDHVVALGDAWQTGAQQLSQAKRIALANDPVNLFAVDGPANEQKSDGDAATWLPPDKSFRCTYVAHQVGVKKAYGLWVTSAEKAAMQRVLGACPTVEAPLSHLSDTAYSGPGANGDDETQHAASAPEASHTSEPAAPGSTSPVHAGVVHPGSYCSPAGAVGSTTQGTSMTCTASSAGSRARWRSTS